MLTLTAIIASKEGNSKVALDYLESASKKEINAAKIYNLIGETFFELEQTDKAEQAFRKSLKIEPDNGITHNGIAKVSIKSKDYNKAIEHALEAVGLIHYSPGAHFHLRVALAESGSRKEAIAAFETCLSMAKHKKQVYPWLIRLCKATGADEQLMKYRALSQKADRRPAFFFIE